VGTGQIAAFVAGVIFFCHRSSPELHYVRPAADVSLADGTWLNYGYRRGCRKIQHFWGFFNRVVRWPHVPEREKTRVAVECRAPWHTYEAYLTLQKRQHRFTWSGTPLLESTAINAWRRHLLASRLQVLRG